MRNQIRKMAYGLGYRRCVIGLARLEPAQRPAALPDGLRLGPFGLNDLEAFSSAGGMDVEETPVRLLRGDRPWGLWLGDELACYGWSTTQPTSLSTRVALAPQTGEAYLFSFFTHPRHRGHGYYPLLLRAICEALAQEGLHHAWISVAPYNIASRRGIEKAGFMVAATHATLRGRCSLLLTQPDMPFPELRPYHRGLHLK